MVSRVVLQIWIKPRVSRTNTRHLRQHFVILLRVTRRNGNVDGVAHESSPLGVRLEGDALILEKFADGVRTGKVRIFAEKYALQGLEVRHRFEIQALQFISRDSQVHEMRQMLVDVVLDLAYLVVREIEIRQLAQTFEPHRSDDAQATVVQAELLQIVEASKGIRVDVRDLAMRATQHQEISVESRESVGGYSVQRHPDDSQFLGILGNTSQIGRVAALA